MISAEELPHAFARRVDLVQPIDTLTDVATLQLIASLWYQVGGMYLLQRYYAASDSISCQRFAFTTRCLGGVLSNSESIAIELVITQSASTWFFVVIMQSFHRSYSKCLLGVSC